MYTKNYPFKGYGLGLSRTKEASLYNGFKRVPINHTFASAKWLYETKTKSKKKRKWKNLFAS